MEDRTRGGRRWKDGIGEVVWFVLPRNVHGDCEGTRHSDLLRGSQWKLQRVIAGVRSRALELSSNTTEERKCQQKSNSAVRSFMAKENPVHTNLRSLRRANPHNTLRRGFPCSSRPDR
jgi:hypothetical protein